MSPEASYVIAVDVGGTCTDCVVYRAGGSLQVGKAFSTPPDFAHGVLDSVRVAAAAMDVELRHLLSRTSLFLHGSTVVDNTVITRDGARTGLITTAGFEDTLIVTRGAYGRWSGQPEEVIKHPVTTSRPEPLVPAARILGVRERIDRDGKVVRPLEEADVARALRALAADGVESIAVCLLWSFRNPVHEQRIREIARELVPQVHVCISSEVAPVPGEYERTSTTVINAYAGRVVKSYLDELAQILGDAGYAGPLLVMQGYGGLVPVAEAASRPVGMIECGPAAGVVGARFLGKLLDEPNIIAADMGGTTFKVGVIQDGEFGYAREPIVDRLHYAAAKIDVASIGAGGGSIVSVDPRTRRPMVGPRSAGARPGPVCYGRGGTEPTLTDVAAIIGYMDPNTFLGGSVKLDLEAARRVFREKVAEPMGMEVEEAAVGIYKIAAAQIADLVREVTVERGLDPRDFDLHAFGGSCGLFAGAFATDLSVKRVVVPFTASVNCAFGLATSDVIHEYSRVEPLRLPAQADEVNALFRPMVEQALATLRQEGFAGDGIAIELAADLRYRRQVHQITTPLRRPLPLDAAALDTLASDFERLYEQRYGRGSAYRGAGIEAVTFRVRGRGITAMPAPSAARPGDADASHAAMGKRRMYAGGKDAMALGTTYDFTRLLPGNTVHGPAVIHTPITTVVIQEDQHGRMDEFRNVVIELSA
ncbi:MAG TPA: hydantoinase/oxoprolinase family protein [Burkholderiales bacterium]